jgi:hypothetical protein
MKEPDDFELKRKLDALPRSIEPPEELWPALRARLRPRVARTWWRHQGLRIAALLVLLVGSAAALVLSRHRAGQWYVTRHAGQGASAFRPGDSLTTGHESASFTVGTIGQLEAGPLTRVRLLAAGAGGHRLALDRGTIHASLDAPPRLFIVETPSGTAVDLGCAYTLDVDHAGNSAIRVTAGWVSFEDHGQVSLIPADMRAVTRKGGVVGTPFREDAPDSLRRALAAFDEDPDDSTLALILRSARRVDAVTLWHLVGRTSTVQRDQVVTRLLSLVPPPAGVLPEAILRNDGAAMQLYWEQLPGTLPITPEWKRQLWLWWLKVTG